MVSFKPTIVLALFLAGFGFITTQIGLSAQIFNSVVWLSICLYIGYTTMLFLFPKAYYECTTANGMIKIHWKRKSWFNIFNGEYTYKLKLVHNESNVRAVDSLKNAKIGKYHIFPESVEYYCLAHGTIIHDEYNLMVKFFEALLNNE